MSDQTEEIITFEVDYDEKPQRRSKAPTGTCKECGVDLTDKRRSYCEEHTPSGVKQKMTERTGRSTGVRKGRTDTKLVAGLTSFTGTLLFLLTIMLAWTQLRAAGVPDPNGDLAERLALNDEEAAAIGHPIARVFASTSIGKSYGPKLVENEDLLDAAFALFDWFKRSRTIWDDLGRMTNSDQAPPTATYIERMHSTNGKPTEQGGGNQSSESGSYEPQPPSYVPPAAQDIVGELLGA